MCGPIELERTTMQCKLTDQLLKSIKPLPDRRVVVSDTDRAGLRFRVTHTGKATFLFEKKIKGGKRRAFTLGTYPHMSLSEARAEALRIELEAHEGVDRIAAKNAEEAQRLADEHTAQTVSDVLASYILHHVERNLKPGKSREERKRQLINYLAPIFDKRMEQLTRKDLQRIVDAKAAEGKIPMANRLRAAFCAFTNWAYMREHTENDVGAGVQKAGRETSRTRTLLNVTQN